MTWGWTPVKPGPRTVWPQPRSEQGLFQALSWSPPALREVLFLAERAGLLQKQVLS